MKKSTLLLNLFLLLATVTIAQTNVSGAISSNTTWGLANSPYNVTGSVLVSNGATLTIEAGVVINFSDDYKILVKGNLISSGTSSSLITFNGNSSGGYGSEVMIMFKSTNLSNSTITYNKFIGPQKAIQLADESEHDQDSTKNSGILTITYSNFNNAGIYTKGYDSSAELKFKNSTFESLIIKGYYPRTETISFTDCIINNSNIDSDSYNKGISFITSTIKNSTITMGCCDANFLFNRSILYNSNISEGGGNPVNGLFKVVNSFFISSKVNLPSSHFVSEKSIFFSKSEANNMLSVGNTEISNSSFIGFDNLLSINGIKISGSAGYNIGGNTNLSDNTFFNFNSALILDGKNNLSISNNNIISSSLYNFKNNTNSDLVLENNYWGTSIESEIQNLIFDSNDNIDKGTIDYTPFLTSLNTIAPISPPSNVTKTVSNSDVVLNWSANGESDIAGYKLHYGTPTGYSYAITVDLGNVTTYTLTGGDISTEYAITAYDTNTDGTDDMVDGNESWYAIATQINVAPVLADDTISTNEDTSIDLTLTATDPDSSQITYTLVSNGSYGTVSIANNIATYTPSENFNGADSFTLTANDGEADSNVATISVTVNSVNDKPVANSNSILVDEGNTATILQNGETSLLYNDTDIENDALTAIVVSNPNYGSLTLNTDGTFSYQNDGSETTSDSFTYKTNDGDLDSNLATVNITINPINDNLPTDIMLSNNSIQENLSQTYIGQLTVTDLDLPSDNHTFELVSGNGDDNNTSFTIYSNKYLYSNTSFDYEAQQTLSIRIKVKDANNQYFEKSFVINVINVNDINITSETSNSYCSTGSGSGAINITSVKQTSGTITYNWSASNGGVISSSQENSQNLTDLPDGTYNLSISDDNFTYNESFEVSLIPQYSNLSICRASSDDSEVTKNRIYLNNPENYNVAFYEILKESNVANVYTTIGTIESTENSFLDDTSNNVSQSYNYKVRLIDKCGITSSNSDLHKTILLQSSIAVDNTVNLNWSDYEGINFNTYTIFRNKNQEGFQVIGSVSANSNSYNDTTANVADNNYEYYISIEVDACLNGTASKSLNSSTEIKSNHQNIGTSLSLNDFITLKQVSIYPNPSSIKLNIKLSSGVTLVKGEVYNTLGQIIMETRKTNFSIENLPSSTYFIKIFTSEGATTRRFIKK